MRGNVRSHRAGTAAAEGERVNKRVLLIVANGRRGVGIFYAGRSNMEMRSKKSCEEYPHTPAVYPKVQVKQRMFIIIG